MRNFASPIRTLILLIVAVNVFLGLTAEGQTFKVLYNFTDGLDGGAPIGGATLDQAGNVYGLTREGGSYNGNYCFSIGCGTVFKLSQKSSHWIFSPLHDFTGEPSDGGFPNAPLVFGPDGALYGRTADGGSVGDGTVFNVTPGPTRPASVFAPWLETVLHAFQIHGEDLAGPLVFDRAGNMYGTRYGMQFEASGAPHQRPQDGKYSTITGLGYVFELSPSPGGWIETDLYDFQGEADGAYPEGGVILDAAGNLYGTASLGGDLGCVSSGIYRGCGTVFELSPSGGGWVEKTLYTFEDSGDGAVPVGGMVFDSRGNLYGTTTQDAQQGSTGGTVFELASSGGNWAFQRLHGFNGSYGPIGSLIMDAAGNLYGTTFRDGTYDAGSVFELMPSNGGWAFRNLYSFTGLADGEFAAGTVALDPQGNVFGMAAAGGAHNWGTVWEITP